MRRLYRYSDQDNMQTFQVFTGAAPGSSSTSDLHGWRKCRGLPGAVSAAIHGSRKIWKVLTGSNYFAPIPKTGQPERNKMRLRLKYTQ